jgi:hypothetical protein
MKFQRIGQIVSELHAKYNLKGEPETLVVGANLALSAVSTCETEVAA